MFWKAFIAAPLGSLSLAYVLAKGYERELIEEFPKWTETTEQERKTQCYRRL